MLALIYAFGVRSNATSCDAYERLNYAFWSACFAITAFHLFLLRRRLCQYRRSMQFGSLSRKHSTTYHKQLLATQRQLVSQLQLIKIGSCVRPSWNSNCVLLTASHDFLEASRLFVPNDSLLHVVMVPLICCDSTRQSIFTSWERNWRRSVELVSWRIV